MVTVAGTGAIAWLLLVSETTMLPGAAGACRVMVAVTGLLPIVEPGWMVSSCIPTGITVSGVITVVPFAETVKLTVVLAVTAVVTIETVPVV